MQTSSLITLAITQISNLRITQGDTLYTTSLVLQMLSRKSPIERGLIMEKAPKTMKSRF